MLIQQLILTNYRVYAGRHEFDLSPRKRYGKTRPIVLFGGLNGAGKTSILSGVRLALYGRASFSQRISQRQYDEYLADSVHRTRLPTKPNQSASVELTFTYAKLGVESKFHVTRSWEIKNRNVKEHLRILENGQHIKGLDQEQAQIFLDELIPIGLSDLFFFDGEKISQLADNAGGAVLEHSIKNLLGLDIVERLSGDLTVLNRQLVKGASRDDLERKISAAQDSLSDIRRLIQGTQQEMSIKACSVAETKLRANQIRKLLNERGAHFSISRQSFEVELDTLKQERDTTSQKIIALLGDTAPFSLSLEFYSRLAIQVEKDLEGSRTTLERTSIDKAFKELFARLRDRIDPKTMEEILAVASSSNQKHTTTQKVIHDLTPSQAANLFSTFETSKNQRAEALVLFAKVESIELRIDEIIAALARAPDEALVKEDFENLQITQQEVGKQVAEFAALQERAKAQACEALEIAKQLDKLYLEASKTSDQQRVLDYICNANHMLSEFVTQTAKKKIRELEIQFTECFLRLARKDDLALQIRIDPKTYNVSLLSEDGRRIGKDEISAGEKQIFAISMLQALSKTSGRQLPMIVDTPLGRLDSKHRQKLIEGYFPHASHQMIILSTDTEIDETFYRSLSPEISRAYKLEYNSEAGSTEAKEGYFWQMRHFS